MALERELDEPLEEIRVRDAGRFEELRVDLDGVNPGIVFSSLTSTSPSFVTKQSTRAIPSHSEATKGSTASSGARGCSPVIRAGTDEIHPSFFVLRVPVVPHVVRDDDLADESHRLPVPSTPTSTRCQ